MRSEYTYLAMALFMSAFLQACGNDTEESKNMSDAVTESSAQPEVSATVSHVQQQTIDISILEVMELVITPATNTLWGVGNPQTDEEWALLEEAAAATVAGATLGALGGSGPNDSAWVKAPAYQALNGVMLDAAKTSLEAVRARDLNALIEAGNVLYPPCEACHLQFNPGVINQN